jgi:hypothetical protein
MKCHKLLYGAAVLMVLGCLIHILIDYQKYKTSFTSAPFWVWILVDAMFWLIPAAIVCLLCAAALVIVLIVYGPRFRK